MAHRPATQRFQNSQEAAFRRAIRDRVKKAGFKKSERDIVLVLVNLWFQHRNGPKGFIHPGREKLAKRTGYSVWTVSHCLKMLRSAEVLEATEYERGQGQHATRYKLDLVALVDLCGFDIATLKGGELVPLWRVKSHTTLHTTRSKVVCENHTQYITTFDKVPNQGMNDDNVVPFRRAGGGL